MLEILDGYYNEAVGIDNNHHMLSIARSRIDALELKNVRLGIPILQKHFSAVIALI